MSLNKILRQTFSTGWVAVTSAPGRSHLPSTLTHDAHRQFWSLNRGFRDPNPSAAESESIIRQLKEPKASDPVVVKATELAQQAVSEGSPRGKTLLGSLHREGLVVEKNLDAALSLFEQAAEAGDPIGQCSLGALKLTLLDEDEADANISPSDLRVAVDERGEAKAAQFDLVKSDGTNVPDQATPAQLVRQVRKARRKAGFTDSQAHEYEQHRKTKEDEKKKTERCEAHKWLERAADQSNDEAMMILANDIVKDDPGRAIELYERAAKSARNTDAYYNLGHIYEYGLGDIPVDSKASLKNFSMAAQLGDASAQFYLSHLYRVGTFDIKANESAALHYIQMAVEQSHAGAVYYYALMHHNGDCGLAKDIDKFRLLTEQAAAAGHGPALACLGDMYYKGSDGVELDYERALDYFTRAGRAGESDALCSAAAMHFRGLGAKKDQHMAFQLYQEAALKDSVPALRNIASMYFYGEGVPCNKKIADHFMKVADDTEKRQRDAKLGRNSDKSIQTEPAPDHPMSRPSPQKSV